MNRHHRRRPLRQRAVDHTAALVIAAVILPAVWWVTR